ncbi:2'-5' RNA ligase family protein [Candidatus Methylospira mobilis]|uniref:2'-5' RNA ligase family protein n=1 Tax=Candidatus Methylospira mobilis TaxID=1808979 RepID=UPI0028EE14DD|nr:2'-5' RNA ligase family protein [Candidatus Methylospira mobilis]WNV04668.1 2'-5' RNA ligase family protein [Candidatus Methylospira mobilis]
MRYCIYLTFDRQTHLILQQLQEKLAARAPGFGLDGKLWPHLSLLVFDDADQDGVLIRFDRVADGLNAFVVELNGINIFSGRRSVVFVELVPSFALQDGYLRSLNIFSGSTAAPEYRAPDLWKPHVTIAKGRGNGVAREIKELADSEWAPRTADVDGIGLINVQKPAEVLAARLFDHRSTP